jgi:hypothetical protein
MGLVSEGKYYTGRLDGENKTNRIEGHECKRAKQGKGSLRETKCSRFSRVQSVLFTDQKTWCALN